MQSYYSEFKKEMRAAGYPVDESDDFAIEDLKWIPVFLASAAYNSGVPFNQALATSGLAYPSVLPPVLSSQFGSGIVNGGVVWDNATVDGLGQKLLIGSNNPVGKWTLCNGTSVQVGIGPRYRNSVAPVAADADGSYRILREDLEGNEWAFAFSVATKGEATLGDYEIHLIFTLNSNGAPSPVLDFTYDADSNEWSAEGIDPITDSVQDENGTVVQNIESYALEFLKQHLLPESIREEGTPYGKYTVTLTATSEDDSASVSVPFIIL